MENNDQTIKRKPIFMVNNDGIKPLSTKSAPNFSEKNLTKIRENYQKYYE